MLFPCVMLALDATTPTARLPACFGYRVCERRRRTGVGRTARPSSQSAHKENFSPLLLFICVKRRRRERKKTTTNIHTHTHTENSRLDDEKCQTKTSLLFTPEKKRDGEEDDEEVGRQHAASDRTALCLHKCVLGITKKKQYTQTIINKQTYRQHRKQHVLCSLFLTLF